MTELNIDIQSMAYHATPLITNFSLHVKQGEIVALLGPSGIGKTTLLRMIAGLETRYAGVIGLNNRTVRSPSPEIQLVFQEHRLLPWKTVSQNITLADDKTIDSTKLAYWLKFTGLETRKDAWPKELSGGQASRVALARALYAEPQILLLDEPFQGLDQETKQALMKPLRKLLKSKRMTAIFVTHDARDARYFTDTVYTFTGPPLQIVQEQTFRDTKRGTRNS